MVKNSTTPRVGIITQARIGSTRLPAKVLKTIAGKTLLEYHLQRLNKSELPVFVATTNEEGSHKITDIASQFGCQSFAGSLEDVLARFYGCAEQFQLDVVVRVTSDCPLIDGTLIAESVKNYLKIEDYKNCYYSNVIQRQFPRGFDFEIFSFEMLKKAFETAKEPAEREHVTPYLYNKKDPSVRLLHIPNPLGDFSEYRLTVDVPEDFVLVQKLIEDYGCESKSYGEIIQVLNQHPELLMINKDIVQKKI